MNRSGSNLRMVSSGYFYEWQSPQWTPDGKWVLVGVPGLRFLNVENGTTLPLTYGGAYRQAAVRPSGGG